MNKARREAATQLLSHGYLPQEAYEITKQSKNVYAHAVWKDGALVAKSKIRKVVTK